MEARLSTLQERMKQQDAAAAQSTAKAGAGATWGSARKDKGSVSSYGKEVKEKVKKQLETTVPRESLLRSTASARRMMQTNDGDFKTKGNEYRLWQLPVDFVTICRVRCG
jgi:arginine/lysine/ornithine decarboxylase